MHIAKTGGRHVLNSIIKPIYSNIKKAGKQQIIYPTDLKESDPNFSLDSKFQRHGCWRKEIDKNTYVVSILRDPIETVVSIFSQMYQEHNGNFIEEKIIDKNKFKEVDKNEFIKWLTENKHYNNFQFKNFSNPVEVDFDIIGRERVKRTNLLLDFKHIGNNDYLEKAYNRICLDLDIEMIYPVFIEKNEDFFNPLSKIIYSSLDKQDIDLIRGIIDIDIQMYESKDLNWLV